jgi:sorbitol/mannitol transport system substrate-binding protein
MPMPLPNITSDRPLTFSARYLMFYFLLMGASFLFSTPFLNAEPRKLRIAAYDLRPYVTEKDEEPGYLYEIICNAFQQAGYEIEIQFYPPLRAQSLVESGERDVLIPSYRPESGQSGESKLKYSQAIHGSEIVMIKRADTPLSKLPKLSGSSTLVASGLSEAEDFQLKEKNLLPSMSERAIQTIDRLNQKRIDYAIVDKLAAANAIVSRRLPLVGAIDFVSPPIAKRDFFVGFSPKLSSGDKVLADFNRALSAMYKRGEVQNLLARYGYEALENQTKTLSILLPLNEDTKNLHELSSYFLKKHPGVQMKWNLLEENLMRRRFLTSLTLAEPIFDILMIGQVNVPQFATKGWISQLEPLPKSYNAEDILPIVQKELTYKDKLYALPFYHETSMTFYRKDLFEKKNLQMPMRPSYSDLKRLAAQLDDPKSSVNGICMRGKSGQGENTSNILAIVRAFGGQYFNEQKDLDLTSEAWRQAIQLYTDLLIQYGPDDPARYGYNELLKLFADGHCAIWIDASVAAGFVMDPKHSKVSDAVGFAYMPKETQDRNFGWSWTWAFSVVGSSQQKALAQEFMEWASSEEYTALVARLKGWKAVPPGIRISTYKNADYQKASSFAPFVLKMLQEKDVLAQNENGIVKSGKLVAEPLSDTLEVPVFQALRIALGLNVAQVLKGHINVKRALLNTEQEVKSVMYHSGYYTATRPDEKIKKAE